MDFDIDRSIRRGQLPTGASYRRQPFDAPEFQSRNSGVLNAIILAALDRDSDVRREYLRKRWQGVVI